MRTTIIPAIPCFSSYSPYLGHIHTPSIAHRSFPVSLFPFSLRPYSPSRPSLRRSFSLYSILLFPPSFFLFFHCSFHSSVLVHPTTVLPPFCLVPRPLAFSLLYLSLLHRSFYSLSYALSHHALILLNHCFSQQLTLFVHPSLNRWPPSPILLLQRSPIRSLLLPTQ